MISPRICTVHIQKYEKNALRISQSERSIFPYSYICNSSFLALESMEIIDKTETNMVALRRLIYLTIQSR